ncbi:sensor histidine kinase [Saccharibacillus kuerlensis]|uniref:histidine kinase n=1 Tax=Saccharibacillus kuerlensis TaxID=459527 RepID=A0ABQ2L241_9BACL|nr:HAMP domain-containing sensor histidine kinase [Saccharibacillus kuerlensis]GGO00055.1 hypothetical protein GCM10010969_20850 [Saccharibacillus kuerlensis]
MRTRSEAAVKFRHSLMARYLMLVGLAIFLLPIILILVMVLYLGYTYLIWQPGQPDVDRGKYVNSSTLGNDWHQLAESLDGASADEIVRAVKAFRTENPLVQVAAVDAEGQTLYEEPQRDSIPDAWTAGWTAEFMKRATANNSEVFAVVAFVGEKDDPLLDRQQGFIVAEVPRAMTVSAVPNQNGRMPQFVAISLFVLLFLLFAFLSWAFFYRIRKRLVRLQEAMTAYDDAGIPLPVGPGKRQDEITTLEGTFNQMVHKLRAGREREREEEELRKKLIANLSHDLRTPLTVIRSHAYSLESEPLGERGRESLTLMARKLDDLGGLIDNLLSYTLIAAGRYPMRIEETDVLRIVRTAAAQWYPVFEKEGMEVDADLPEESMLWHVDREWLIRILDNLFQNAVRHAKEGRYIGLSLGPPGPDGRRPLQIRDKGPGMRGDEALQPSAVKPDGSDAAKSDETGFNGASSDDIHAEESQPGEGRVRLAANSAVQAADMPTALQENSVPDGQRGHRRRNPLHGAGIGLSIVDLMIREMGMSWNMESGAEGVTVTIWPTGRHESQE